jgi:hypothetical protein
MDVFSVPGFYPNPLLEEINPCFRQSKRDFSLSLPAAGRFRNDVRAN